MSAAEPSQRHYFVDEAGDPTLFDARGRALPGQEGCSRYFILGVLDVPNPDALALELDALRAELLADPYFRDVPSMQFERRKTAWMFHAKDDVPEVRREVFRVLMRYPVQFFAVVRDKFTVLDYVRQSSPRNDVPLQATDYFLWALQRHFERGESRYIELLWPQVGLVHAVDETAAVSYGVYYTKKKPLPKSSG